MRTKITLIACLMVMVMVGASVIAVTEEQADAETVLDIGENELANWFTSTYDDQGHPYKGCTLRLVGDQTTTVRLFVMADCTLDLNGYRLTIGVTSGETEGAGFIIRTTNFTLTDGSPGKTGYIGGNGAGTNNMNRLIAFHPGAGGSNVGTFTVSGVHHFGYCRSAICAPYGGSTMIIDDVDFTDFPGKSKSNPSFADVYPVYMQSNVTTKVSNSVLSGRVYYNGAGADLTCTDCQFITLGGVASNYFLSNTAGTLNLIRCSGTQTGNVVPIQNSTDTNCVVNLTDCTFTCTYAGTPLVNSKGIVNVFSGTYATNDAPAFDMQPGNYTMLNIYGGTFNTGTANAVSLSGGTLGNLSKDVVFNSQAEYPIQLSGDVKITGDVDFGSNAVQATGALTVESGGSVKSDTLIESTADANININSGGAFVVKQLTTDQGSVNLNVDEGTVLDIGKVEKTDGTDITQETAQKLIDDGAAGTIGDTTVYCVAYMNYKGTVMGQTTWMSSQASPTILSADAAQALKTGELLVPAGKEYIGWTQQYTATGTGAVSDDLAPGKNPVNGNYQIYPVYKTTVDANAATKVGTETYETIADAINFAKSGSVITVINDVNQALTIDSTTKDLSINLTNGVSYKGDLTTISSVGTSKAKFSSIVAGNEGVQISVGSVSVAGKIVSGTVTTISGTTEVASGAVLTLSKNAKLSVNTGNFVNNGIIYVYGEISKDGVGTLTNNGKIYLMTSKASVAAIDQGSKAIKEYSSPSNQSTTGTTVDPIITVLNAQQTTTNYQPKSTSDDAIIIVAAGVSAIAAACLAFMIFRRT